MKSPSAQVREVFQIKTELISVLFVWMGLKASGNSLKL